MEDRKLELRMASAIEQGRRLHPNLTDSDVICILSNLTKSQSSRVFGANLSDSANGWRPSEFVVWVRYHIGPPPLIISPHAAYDDSRSGAYLSLCQASHDEGWAFNDITFDHITGCLHGRKPRNAMHKLLAKLWGAQPSGSILSVSLSRRHRV